MKARISISTWLFAFGLGFAFFQIMPTLLPRFVRKPLTCGDVLDFLTPLVVIPLVYTVYLKSTREAAFQEPDGRAPFLPARIILFLGALLYVDGHGLHLSANSIARLLKPVTDTEIYRAAYLFDEVISHFMWDGGVFLISVGLILAVLERNAPPLSRTDLFLVFLGAALYGFTFTVNGIEGQTVVFTFPAAGIGCALALFLFAGQKRRGHPNPLALFFLTGYLLSLILFAFWGIRYAGFPEFSELGWIR